MANIHSISDESLGGIKREYVEVERKARVGDKIFVLHHADVDPCNIAKIYTTIGFRGGFTETDGFFNDDYQLILAEDEYKTLEPTDIVHIEGKRYRLVDRKAEIGEKVLIVDAVEFCGMYGNGNVVEVKGTDEEGILNEKLIESNNPYGYVFDREYRVLEPVADAIIADEFEPTVDARHASPEVIDLLANLARRVTSLESQLRDTQSNVEKLAEELESTKKTTDLAYLKATTVDDINDVLVDQINEIDGKVEMALDDIVTLDERTQPKEYMVTLPTINIDIPELHKPVINVNMPELPGDEAAKCVCEMLKRLATNGSERP